MLCKNEADRLPRTLAPISAFAEWLIYDTGSTDASVDIARQAGAKVISHPWQGFSKTRIHQFQAASQPWILWLDADEIITSELLKELRMLFESKPRLSAYRINRMIFFEGKWIKHGDWFPDYNTRLFRQGSWHMKVREVHESVEVKGEIGHLKHYLEHYSFRSWEDKEQRSHHYAELWASMESNSKKRTSPFTPILRAVWKFIRGYLLKRGFLDGFIGLKIALSNARETHLKYSLLRGLQHRHSLEAQDK